MGSSAIRETLTSHDTLEVLRVLNVEQKLRLDVQQALLEGSDAGETILELADRVEELTESDRRQCVRIARNVMGFVLSKARWEQAVSVGMTHKIWLCAPNCPIFGHGQAAQRYATPIPLSEPFIVNNIPLMFARDFLSGHVGECIDCECMMITKLLRKFREFRGNNT